MTALLVISNTRTSGGGRRVASDGVQSLRAVGQEYGLDVIVGTPNQRPIGSPSHILYLSETALPVPRLRRTVTVRIAQNLKTVFPLGRRERVRAAFSKGLLRMADVCIVPNDFSRLAFEGHGIPIRSVVPFGIGAAFFPPETYEDGGYAVVVTGSGWQRSNHLLRDASRVLLQDGIVDEVRVVSGPGTDLRAVSAWPGVRVVQVSEDSELADLYRGARFAMLLSCLDSFGFPFLEAAACATPILGLHNGSLLEYGLVGSFTSGRPSDLRRAAEECTDLRRIQGRRLMLTSQAVRERYNWDQFARGVLRVVLS